MNKPGTSLGFFMAVLRRIRLFNSVRSSKAAAVY